MTGKTGRPVAVCRIGTEDLNAWMVRQGWAIAYRHYSAEYVDEEDEARSARRGVWRGEFVPPWDWRRGTRLAAETTAPAPLAAMPGGECNIKGNISSSGERIYHVPGQQHYDRTVISEANGERWFCTEDEARAAGWRRAKR